MGCTHTTGAVIPLPACGETQATQLKMQRGRVENKGLLQQAESRKKGGGREEIERRMWAGDKAALPYVGHCATSASAKVFSFSEMCSLRSDLPSPRLLSQTWAASGWEKLLQPLSGEGIT